MMNKKSNKPYLRFPGFTDAWEKRKLGEITQVIMGVSPSSKNYSLDLSDPILVQGNADMIDGQVVPRIHTKQITKTAKKGSLILSVRAPVGEVGKTEFDVVLGRGVAGISGNEFLFQYLNNIHSSGYWKVLSSGSTFDSVTTTQVLNLLVYIPTKREQQQIGTFFQKLDSLIAANQREYKKLTDLKNAYLHKMFPADGKDVPELRFPGFTDAWEKRKLGEMTKLVSGYSFKSSNFGIGSFPVIRITNILENGSVGGTFVTYEKKELADKYIAKSGQLVIAMSGATTGKIGQVSATALVNQRVGLFAELAINVRLLKVFLASSSFKKYIGNLWGAGAQPNVSVKQINSYEISIPATNNEQQQIGIFFQKLDSLIAANQREGKKLEELKQSLLKEMFV
ncbi:restriction endonuclease subunit S [Furfurilactobacillus curtus]|uniref:Type I site-specific deoxyribonuclease n=1 Tax=Furfurilactobacillus curtus TaxID=1746200 RepID=A0ABQ5JM29_9LACO